MSTRFSRDEDEDRRLAAAAVSAGSIGFMDWIKLTASSAWIQDLSRGDLSILTGFRFGVLEQGPMKRN